MEAIFLNVSDQDTPRLATLSKPAEHNGTPQIRKALQYIKLSLYGPHGRTEYVPCRLLFRLQESTSLKSSNQLELNKLRNS